MAKIAYIGAGSRGFAKRFLMDIMVRPALAESTVVCNPCCESAARRAVTLAQRAPQQYWGAGLSGSN